MAGLAFQEKKKKMMKFFSEKLQW